MYFNKKPNFNDYNQGGPAANASIERGPSLNELIP
jgi:hypothetical protein